MNGHALDGIAGHDHHHPSFLAEQEAQHPFPKGNLSTIGDPIARGLLSDADPQIVFHPFRLIFPTAVVCRTSYSREMSGS